MVPQLHSRWKDRIFNPNSNPNLTPDPNPNPNSNLYWNQSVTVLQSWIIPRHILKKQFGHKS